MKEEESYKIAKRAVKISIVCLFITVVLGLLNIYTIVSEAHAISEMSRDIKLLKKDVYNAKLNDD